MPASFTRLRIAGFKSFAEPAVLEIRPGLTGIVGPNGCGKSNVVEALRWAMGEGSARALRGGEMDDVIFAGTAARPSRNIAEVALVLDDAQGMAPPPLHEAAELEVVRRIERGGGSLYRVNGREVRARDVQTLFADLTSGARSSAMVSQGRVGAIIAARPEERRALLEEAAGITGLHARRHEADQKLHAAETNLSRAEDLKAQLDGQLQGLQVQARQAARYVTVAGTVRAAEAELLAIRRARAQALRDTARSASHAAEQAAAQAGSAATAAAMRAAAAAAALPELREREAQARTGLERHRLGLEQLAAAAANAQALLDESRGRAAQVARDLGHAEQGARDAAAACARLDQEAARIEAEDAAHPAALARAEAEAAGAAEAATAAAATADHAIERAAELAARHRALADALAQAEPRARRLAAQAAGLTQQREALRAQAVEPVRLAHAEADRIDAARALEVARAALTQAEQTRAACVTQAAAARVAAQAAAQTVRRQAQASLAAAREAAATADSARARVAAETQVLAELLAVGGGEAVVRMVDLLEVPAGLEAALGAVLGEELEEGADSAAPRHWRELPPLSEPARFPAHVTSLAALVQGPPALSRALSRVGLAEDAAQAAAAQPELPAGTALVSRAGALWRWDGYTMAAGAPTAAAVRLQQRNRLSDLRARLAVADTQAAAARAAHAAALAADREHAAAADATERAARRQAEAAERDAAATEARARAARRDAEQLHERARETAATLAAQAQGAAARMTALDQQASHLDAELADATQALLAARAAHAELADPAVARAALERARAALTAARSRDAEARGARDALARDATARAQRAGTLGREREDWRLRAAESGTRSIDLAARDTAARAALAAQLAAPAAALAGAAAARAATQRAEAAHHGTTAALSGAETEAADTDRAARAAGAALALAREAVVRAEGERRQADHAWGVVAERILERFGARPALPDPPADVAADSEDKARRRLERLQREREEIGPVNLRAHAEADEVARRIADLARERDELATAIAKLRGSIGHLNREGRERLAAVFEQVDRAFQSLFARNFGGGKAHLALVGSDDPLLAGLEIYAQPPGKRLTALSLLSGGEQALTALSLIFAAFRCNPAPVCVLDEVDAPLDDANVGRFCALLADMVRETGTRFLVVTHHPLTMARMDRLYGVTMQERGVSRLLSVDLSETGRMVEPPRMAAE